MLSFAANTIYMAISCSNLQVKSEPSENSTTGEIMPALFVTEEVRYGNDLYAVIFSF